MICPDRLLRDRQGMNIPYCYGLYKFELGGEVCEGFVLEDLSEFTKSVRDWFVQKQGRGKLDTGQFGTLVSLPVLVRTRSLLTSFPDPDERRARNPRSVLSSGCFGPTPRPPQTLRRR